MKRTFAAGLLTLSALLAAGSEARAQYPGCSGAIPPPGCAGAALPQGSCAHFGCGGFCFRFLGAIHFHGPLFNYGPYTGYYPFEPYGPWNAQLQYTGPRPSDIIGCGWHGLFGGKCGKCGGKHGHGEGCGGCGWGDYASDTFRNVFHRTHPRCHKARCGSCGDI